VNLRSVSIVRKGTVGRKHDFTLCVMDGGEPVAENMTFSSVPVASEGSVSENTQLQWRSTALVLNKRVPGLVSTCFRPLSEPYPLVHQYHLPPHSYNAGMCSTRCICLEGLADPNPRGFSHRHVPSTRRRGSRRSLSSTRSTRTPSREASSSPPSTRSTLPSGRSLPLWGPMESWTLPPPPRSLQFGRPRKL
jgi:hypothetical protein